MQPISVAGTLVLALSALVCLVTGHMNGLDAAPDPLCLLGLSLSLFAFAAARRPRPATRHPRDFQPMPQA